MATVSRAIRCEVPSPKPTVLKREPAVPVQLPIQRVKVGEYEKDRIVLQPRLCTLRSYGSNRGAVVKTRKDTGDEVSPFFETLSEYIENSKKSQDFEIISGRLAMIVFAATVTSEVVTGNSLFRKMDLQGIAEALGVCLGAMTGAAVFAWLTSARNRVGRIFTVRCSTFVDSLIDQIVDGLSRLSKRCEDPNLRSFERLFDVFANSGHDSYCWVLSPKEMEVKHRKMDRYVTLTATLYKEMEELSTVETALRKSLHCSEYDNSSVKEQKVIDLQQKVFWQRQEVKYLRERSLWNRSFDTVVSMLVRSAFTVLARIKLVFGLSLGFPASLPRCLSASATVHPTENPNTCTFVSGPLKSPKLEEKKDLVNGFFESNSKLLKPPASTLGAAALALHYSNLIIVMEKMIKQPQLVGVDARDDLYAMLPSSVRSSLRARLKGVGFSASDPMLAGEWRIALGRILGWLSPLAHNMIKWQSERSFEQQNMAPKTNVLLLQTLFFANKEKTEAAITELLVGLNYIWRFEREMTAKALFECTNLNGLLNQQSSS